MKKSTSIEVYFHDQSCEQALCMGLLQSSVLRGKEIFDYKNTPHWLQQKQARNLDPDLQHFVGKQYPPTGKQQFGLFLDSAPDRWGRTLMQRRELILAQEEGRPPHKLNEADYLLGVYDGNRMGALRFKNAGEDAYLDNHADLAAPPWTQIRELEAASWMLETDQAQEQRDYKKWLRQLMAPGSSLGGARPKASVTDEKNALWIAKFPSRNDSLDRGAWEMLAYQLATQCGIKMAPCKAQRFGMAHHSFLCKRFDRNEKGERIHFSSAMTQLGYSDGQSSSEGISYLEIAEWLMTHSHQPALDLLQLWQRIVFSIAISNCDDHLRNHGFLLSPKGWELSPAYDINPDEFGTGLKLNISEDDNSLNLNLALSIAPLFGIRDSQANDIIKKTIQIVKGWPAIANKLGISHHEQSIMQQAFVQQ